MSQNATHRRDKLIPGPQTYFVGNLIKLKKYLVFQIIFISSLFLCEITIYQNILMVKLNWGVVHSFKYNGK